MPTLRFLDQGKDIPFAGELLESFICSFPIRERCSPLASALGRYGMSLPKPPEGVEKLLYAQRDQEWDAGGHAARCRLLGDENFLGLLSEKQAQLVLSSMDEHFLRALARGLARFRWGVLPASPRLSPETRIRLMEAILAAHERDGAKDSVSVPDAVARRMAVRDATQLAIEEFPREEVWRAFEICFYPEKYRMNPSVALGHAPLEMAITLGMCESVWQKQDMLATYALQQRHGREQRVVLDIGGEEFPLNLELLLTICDYCDLEEKGASLVTPLFDTGHPLVRASIVSSGHLSPAQQDEAWEGGDIGACRKLLELPEFYDNLSDSQAEDIIAIDDRHMLQTVARLMYVLYLPKEHPGKGRLSPSVRDRLLAFVACHKNPEITRFFDPHDIIPQQLLDSLKQDTPPIVQKC
ncbi:MULTISPECIES: hypothetical protein [unclassified Desulfovibrio]|uniref:hypothetical protein n=1 Tax=unclassified Desulfovibrio TaxID=2593640 RepID=UPI0013EE3DF0|nr:MULTISPECIES: hypothetical protein [unclassified Desulfovibrio]